MYAAIGGRSRQLVNVCVIGLEPAAQRFEAELVQNECSRTSGSVSFYEIGSFFCGRTGSALRRRLRVKLGTKYWGIRKGWVDRSSQWGYYRLARACGGGRIHRSWDRYVYVYVYV